MRILNKSGQYLPLAAMVIFSGFVLLIAVANVYRVTKAKLQVQNMADAAALAVASMEAKEINVVVDRDEWMNHMYATGIPHNPHQLPNISKTQNLTGDGSHGGLWSSGTPKALDYAQLVAGINQAQTMFRAAYERFMGADQGTTPGQNAGPGGLADVLAEIGGLKDPNVTVAIYNFGGKDTEQGVMGSALNTAQQQNGQSNSSGASVNVLPFMKSLPFETVPVTIYDSDKKKNISLKDELGLSADDPDIGWMRPKWEDTQNMMQVNTKPGQSSPAIGAGAVVVKRVPLLLPLVKPMYVTAHSAAYVVKDSGLSVDPTSHLTGSGGQPKPPDHFRPTYFVKLGYPS